MKVIDLLNKIEKGEEVPKKIIVNGEIYEWDTIEHYYENDNGEDLLELARRVKTKDLLNMPVVKIIEDELIEDEIDIQAIEHNELDILQEVLGECDLWKGNEKYILKVINENNSRIINAISKVSQENEILKKAIKQLDRKIKEK